MKFLSLYYTHKPGGLCKRLYRLLQAVELEHDAIYLCLDDPPVDIHGFRKIWFPWKARKGPLFWCFFGVLSAIQAAITARRERPQVLVAFHPIYALLLWPAALVSKAKIALFFRAVPHKTAEIRGECWTGMLLRIVEYLAVLASKKVFLISNAMKLELPYLPEDKIRVVPNDIVKSPKPPQESRLPYGTQRFKILSSGVFDSRKNIEVVIDAISLLSPQVCSQVCVYLVGDGERLAALKLSVQALGLSDNFIFTGWIEDFTLPVVDLVIHPAKHEGLSNSVLEALSANVPVIASKIPEHAEFFAAEALFESAEELAAMITECLVSPGKLLELKQAQGQLKDRLSFDWSKTIISELTSF